MNQKQSLEHHLHEIQRHKEAINSLGVFRKCYILPVKIPFKINYNYPITCPRCKMLKTTLVFYRSVLQCSKCAYRKYGKMELIKKWDIV